MRRICVLGLAVAVVVVALLLPMSHASAQPVAGAYYSGQITGCDEPPCGCDEPPCGSVSFRVSGDGLQVQEFKAYDMPGVGCQYVGPQPYPGDLPIDEYYGFGPGDLDWYVVSGTFLSEGSAEGTLRLAVGEPPLCDTGGLHWTAIAGPIPVGGIAVLPDVSDSAARDYVALAGLAAAALVAVTVGAWWARRRWLS
jgi:hypothetical protein